MIRRLLSRFRAPRRLQRGQAMVEYSYITFVLACSGGVGVLVTITLLINAVNTYLGGIYFMLNLALP